MRINKSFPKQEPARRCECRIMPSTKKCRTVASRMVTAPTGQRIWLCAAHFKQHRLEAGQMTVATSYINGGKR